MIRAATALAFFLSVLARLVADEVRVHDLDSPFQKGRTTVRVLLPDRLESACSYRVLYVLPVVAGSERRFGDGLAEVRKLDAHNRHGLICVAPEFTSPPWFADHDLYDGVRDESHLLKVVLPFVEENYPVLGGIEGRLLVGFSKSGWGALSLLLRNSKMFHRAAAWDTGIRVDLGPIEEKARAERIARDFGTAANFEKYRLSRLIRDGGRELGPESRFFYYNTGGRRAQGGSELHQLMVELAVPHTYLYEPKRPHRWDSGWLRAAIDFLAE